MKVALYARVSKDDMYCENQKTILIDYCKRNNFTEYDYFQDEISSRKTRPEKERLVQELRKGVYKTIIVARIDRFARSLQELVMDVRGIVENGGRFISVLNGFDFQKSSFNASQQLMLNIFASFAEFEREIIRERTLEGLARVRMQGKKLGRKTNGTICTCGHSATRHTKVGCRTCACDTPYANLTKDTLSNQTVSEPHVSQTITAMENKSYSP